MHNVAHKDAKLTQFPITSATMGGHSVRPVVYLAPIQVVFVKLTDITEDFGFYGDSVGPHEGTQPREESTLREP